MPDTSPPISGKADLVGFLESGAKPADQWRIGTEHEKFAYDLETLGPVPYDGPRGVKALLEGLYPHGWEPVYEGDNVIALKSDHHNSVSLEPGGQVELSGAPLKNLHQTCDEVTSHRRIVKEVGAALGIGFLGLGFHPAWKREDIHWMPKGRYAIMRRYMPTVGSLGLDMMLRTCTVQVNLDFADEASMVEMYRVSAALQPVATALFANSPFTEGGPNGYLSYRMHIWTDTDADRCGMPEFVFEDGFGFERYVDYLLDVPMYFVKREGRYIDAAGQSFRDFMAGKLPALPGELPTMADFEDHLSTVFPDVRLKRYLEMRGADGAPWSRLCALPALWTGLLYDAQSRGAALELIAGWTAEDRAHLRREVPRLGLATPFRGATVRELALTVLGLAREGLARRNIPSALGNDEQHYLDPLQKVADSGQTPAEELLEAFHGRWTGTVCRVLEEYGY
ncbi:glutamate--cysteine ligase [Roseospirillum parvum]|uniref:Glutamate--cysteine ligase n=1 Tax=Roseospirillum parvum TaxID=83401 RepID=A0A1G8CHX6_9PROT|nr:glutamate--cysteine ligase [Roseospirillum parvum]SDH44813.1 glutamate--cysteine ligase [Roseospirillum parvum]